MRLLSLISLIIASLSCFGHTQSFYNTRYNDFATINHSQQAQVNGDFLQLTNDGDKPVIVTDTTPIDIFDNYKYYIKFANLHNKEGKSYKVTDSLGKSHKVSSTKCGIVFNHVGDSYWMVTASCHNSSLYQESVDERTMTIELSKVVEGKEEVVDRITLDNGVDLDEGYNYLCAQVDGDILRIKAGKDQLKEIITHKMTGAEEQMKTGHPTMRVGYYVGPGALISIERTVLAVDESEVLPSVALETSWTVERLDKHFEESKNPYEGYWIYLDRDMEDQWMKLGGRYTIALVETETGYDVIYVDGAQVKKSQWHAGMKKAEMTKTIFTDNFTGKWYDATLEPIADDVYITFESGVILSFKFPVYKSQVRFSKVLK